MIISLRQLLVVALLIAAFWLFRRWRGRLAAHRSSRLPPEPAYQETVRCIGCGVYLPRGQALGSAQAGYRCPDTACSTRRHSPG